MKSQLGDCVSVSWLSVYFAFAGLILFSSRCFSSLICQSFPRHLAEVLRSPEYYEIALNHKFKRGFADHAVIKYKYEKFK